MRTLATIGPLFVSDIGETLFGALRSEFPQAVAPHETHVFEIEVDASSPAYEWIVGLLRGAGFEPVFHSRSCRPDPKRFPLRKQRLYARLDLASGPAVEYRSSRLASGSVEIGGKGICLPIEQLLDTRGWMGLGGSTDRNIVHDDIRRELEARELKGLRFVETIPYRDESHENMCSWDEVGGPWWMIDSPIVLPALSESVDIRDLFGNPVSPGYRDGHFFIWEGLYDIGELHYDAKAWEDVPEFDVALTYEGGRAFDRREVVSQRFMDVCLELGFDDFRWIPVHVDG